MKAILAGLTLAAGLGLTALPSTAAPFSIADTQTQNSAVEQVQWHESRCRQLRRACRNKDARGERGEGNCRRYRVRCQRWWN